MVTPLDPNRTRNNAYTGLSTNAKPTPSDTLELHNGDRYIEMDTGNVFFWDEENAEWLNPFE